jgi:hypothetical protein
MNFKKTTIVLSGMLSLSFSGITCASIDNSAKNSNQVSASQVGHALAQRGASTSASASASAPAPAAASAGPTLRLAVLAGVDDIQGSTFKSNFKNGKNLELMVLVPHGHDSYFGDIGYHDYKAKGADGPFTTANFGIGYMHPVVMSHRFSLSVAGELGFANYKYRPIGGTSSTMTKPFAEVMGVAGYQFDKTWSALLKLGYRRTTADLAGLGFKKSGMLSVNFGVQANV